MEQMGGAQRRPFCVIRGGVSRMRCSTSAPPENLCKALPIWRRARGALLIRDRQDRVCGGPGSAAERRSGPVFNSSSADRAALRPGHALLAPGITAALSRRQHHDDLAAFETRLLLDFGHFTYVVAHAVEQLVA